MYIQDGHTVQNLIFPSVKLLDIMACTWRCFVLQLDVLVNNAGRSQRANWEDIDLAVDTEMFDLNVFSVLSLSRIALQYFMKQNKGHIVVTSSLAGVIAIPHSASYVGAKHAIHVSLYLKLNNIFVA